MTGACDPLSDDCCAKRERDAPATARIHSIWRLLRALSDWRANLVTRHCARNARRVIRLHRMNDYMLKDMGLTRLDDERLASARAASLAFLPE